MQRMSKIQIINVILCGGSGSRIWPLSRSDFPKQFLNLISEKSLLQETFTRMGRLKKFASFNVKSLFLASEKHRFLLLDQIANKNNSKIILEPASRNTAASLTLAALEAVKGNKDPILLVTPSDHCIKNTEVFIENINKSIKLAINGNIVLFGIKPNCLKTGYGFIKQKGKKGFFGEFDVEKFIEKPEIKTAEKFSSNKKYFWNSGIFVIQASVWLKAIKKFDFNMYSLLKTSYKNRTIDDQFIRPEPNSFALSPNKSIDYAVMENLPDKEFPFKLIHLDVGWNDLGSWDAVWEIRKKNNQGNVFSGDVIANQTRNSLVYSNHRLVAVSGINDLIVIETADSVLVVNKNKSQEVKSIIKTLDNKDRVEKDLHRKENRPWGWFDIIDQGPQFKVKRIHLKAGASISLQKHLKRAEHWIVVKGIAQVIAGKKKLILKENESTFIPKNTLHQLSNPGKTILEIIEVQSGDYLGEDDIKRFDDKYGRK
jgi:mannose-1-phosphate guanylyltransferase/mannose-6-phosphate isomerase